jgi:hypothetical protein
VQFIASVTQCADRGAPPTDPKCPAREQDAALRPRPRRRRDDQLGRALAAARAAVEGPEEVVEGAGHRRGPQGLRLGPPRAALLAHARRREVPADPSSASPTAASGGTTPSGRGRGSCACRTRSGPTSASTNPSCTPPRPASGPKTPTSSGRWRCASPRSSATTSGSLRRTSPPAGRPTRPPTPTDVTRRSGPDRQPDAPDAPGGDAEDAAGDDGDDDAEIDDPDGDEADSGDD